MRSCGRPAPSVPSSPYAATACQAARRARVCLPGGDLGDLRAQRGDLNRQNARLSAAFVPSAVTATGVGMGQDPGSIR